ncbi:MAG: S-adenosylmethionine decarboxylase [Solirubrobacteraceae bacterium MAG38_C4-C5]|nr:S-adenosylmethionine decarboxylase [Candidatus Siliceabacter maunaloa]
MAEAPETVAACGDGVIGRMVCVDYGGCDALDVLCDEQTLKGVMDRLCEEIGIRVISNASNSFGPGAGVTSVNVLATSSLSVHTWPELGTACVDLFSCRTDFEDEFVDRFFADAFGATSSARTGFDRVQPARTPGTARAR